MPVVVFGYYTSLLLAFTVTLLVYLVVTKWYRERKYPPGPMGLPLVGYGPFLGKNPHLKMLELQKKYGDIYSFYLGPTLHICVNDFHMAKELLTNPLAMARPEHFFDFTIGRGGFGGMSGAEWQEQRRFTFYTMRNLGLGKGLWETMIQETVVDFVNELKRTKGKPLDVESLVSSSQASNGISLLIGRHLDKEKDAANIEVIRKSTRELMKYFSSVTVNVSIPGLSKVLSFLQLGGYNKFFKLLRRFESIFTQEVEERLKNPDSLTKEDFIGYFCREMEKKELESKNHTFNVLNLMGNLVLLFIAGNDSTVASLSWILLLMADKQDIQKKVYEEIHRVLGVDGVISFEHRNKMPYTMATILEMTRFATIAPLFPPRHIYTEFTYNGYTIPKGSNILVNAWGILHDPRYYENPEEFKPERFLSEDKKKVVKSDGYIAFSLGKRNCPGEGVAIMTIFLYFVSIIQKFHVKLPPGSKADFTPVYGGVMLPRPHDICFIER